MNSIDTPRPWQLAAVSRMARVTSFVLVALAADAVLARNALASAWIIAALVLGPLVVAIRVSRGFPSSLAAAAATFAAAGAIGFASPTRPLLPAAILGIVTALLALRRENSAPTIELTRTNRDGPEPVVIRRWQ
jgi:membrane-associated phospholipid phosphatase